MVLIEPPERDDTAEGSQVPPPLPPAAPADPLARSAAESDPSQLADTVDDSEVFGKTDLQSPGDESLAADAPLSGTAGTLPPSTEWVSPHTQRWRNMLLFTITGVAGIVLAVALFGWWIASNRPDAPEVVMPVIASHGSEQDTESDGVETPEDDDNTEPGDEQPLEEPQDAATDTDQPEHAGTPETEASQTSEEPVAPGGEPQDDGPPTATEETPGDEADAESSPDDESPPGPPPEETDAEGGTSETPPSDLSPADSLRRSLKAFGILLEETAEAPTSLPAPLDVMSGTDTELSRRDRAAIAPPAPPVIDVEERLADRLAQIDFTDAPLAGVLQFLSDFSTVPITLDPDVLPWLNLTPVTPVTINATDASVTELLDSLLPPLGLDYVVAGDQILVSRLPQPDAPLRELAMDLTDLVSDDPEQLEQLRSWLERMVAPESWETNGGEGRIEARDGQLVIHQRDKVLFQVIEFCEKLRVARGLAPRSRFDKRLFRLTSRTERARSCLERKITFNGFRPAPLGTIAAQLGEKGGAHVLIDWIALAENGWYPNAEQSLVVTDTPLGTAFDHLLRPMGLVLRTVDDNVFQITTPQALTRRLEVEFYDGHSKLESAPSREAMLKQLMESIGEELFREHGGPGTVVFDEPSGYLVVALPQPYQQRVEKWLTQPDDLTRKSPLEGEATR